MNASTRALALDILRSTADIFLVVLMVLAPSFVAEAASNVDLQVAETVLLYQRLSGGWPKNYDREQELTEAQRQRVLKERRQNDATVDNGATHTEIRLLAEAYTKTRDIRFKEAALRGIRYLLDGQYKNGGWPQRFPGSSGYQRYITFNDNAMVGILNLLKEVADGKVEYAFVPGDVRQECAQAVQHGIECILKCQIVVAGEPTAWCAQHDHVTLKPRPARSYELASLSGAESVGIVRFLMGIENPDDEVIRAIEGSVNWFERSKLEGIKLVRKEDASKPKGFDYVVVEDPDAPPLWARFYDIKTNQPIFCSRDGVPRRTLAEIAYERRTGYSWLGPYARELLDKDLPDWRRRLSSETSVSKTQSKPAPKAEAVLLRAVTTLDAADEERQTADREEITSWKQSYKAGYVDGQGRYAGGSEILHLEGHKGKLYAANSYWMDPSNIWYGGKDPKTAWSQILRLDRPNGKWEVDLELGPNNLRAENLKSVTFGTDGAGNSLEEPVTLLTATAYSPNPQGADINVFVRDDDTGTWEKTVLLRGTGESGENNSTRCMTVYRDRVTGVDRLFLPVGLLGIFTGVYDPDVPGKIRWDKASETGRLSKRSLAIIEANDSLFYSSGTKIYRRNDGPSPTHSMIFDASQLSKGPVASPVGGVRGLSVIPNPKGPGESLLFVWAPDSRSRSCVVRLDREKNGKYTHKGRMRR
jgi:PelA/Pel-15E family pectate lyase